MIKITSINNVDCLRRDERVTTLKLFITVAYQQQTFITTDQSAFQRAGATGQYAITGQPSPLTPVAPQTTATTPQRPLNGQFIDPAVTPNQSVGYDRQEYVNGYQQQVSIEESKMNQ